MIILLSYYVIVIVSLIGSHLRFIHYLFDSQNQIPYRRTTKASELAARRTDNNRRLREAILPIAALILSASIVWETLTCLPITSAQRFDYQSYVMNLLFALQTRP